MMTRNQRQKRLLDACAAADRATRAASAAVEKRDALLEDSQGAPADGKFSFRELAVITGLSRTRVSQIVYGRRRRDAAAREDSA